MREVLSAEIVGVRRDEIAAILGDHVNARIRATDAGILAHLIGLPAHRTGGAKERLSRNLVDVDLDADVRQLILDQWQRLLTGFSVGALILQAQTLAVLGADAIRAHRPNRPRPGSTAPGRG